MASSLVIILSPWLTSSVYISLCFMPWANLYVLNLRLCLKGRWIRATGDQIILSTFGSLE